MWRAERDKRTPRDPWRDDTLGRTLRAGFDGASSARPSNAVWRRIEQEIEPRSGAIGRLLSSILGRPVHLGGARSSVAASSGALAVGLMLGAISIGVVLSGSRADMGMLYEPVLVTGLSRAEAEIQPLIAPSAIDRTTPAGLGALRWINQWRMEERIRMAEGPFEPRCEAFDIATCGDDVGVSAPARSENGLPSLMRPGMFPPRPAVRF